MHSRIKCKDINLHHLRSQSTFPLVVSFWFPEQQAEVLLSILQVRKTEVKRLVQGKVATAIPVQCVSGISTQQSPRAWLEGLMGNYSCLPGMVLIHYHARIQSHNSVMRWRPERLRNLWGHTANCQCGQARAWNAHMFLVWEELRVQSSSSSPLADPDGLCHLVGGHFCKVTRNHACFMPQCLYSAFFPAALHWILMLGSFWVLEF